MGFQMNLSISQVIWATLFLKTIQIYMIYQQFDYKNRKQIISTNKGSKMQTGLVPGEKTNRFIKDICHQAVIFIMTNKWRESSKIRIFRKRKKSDRI